MNDRKIAAIFSALLVLCALPAFAQEVDEGDDGHGKPDMMKNSTATVLPAPPMMATYATSNAKPAKTRLVLVSKAANKITDEDKWFARIGMRLPDYAFMGANQAYADDQLPDGCPMTYNGLSLLRALPLAQSGRTLLIYGSDPSDLHTLTKATSPEGKAVYALDFAAYRSPTTGTMAGRTQTITFAQEDATGTLFVSNAVNGYAKEVANQTGYITALAPKTGKLLWRSAPLSSNARTFAETPDAIICGYGFTAEPDFLYVLDKKTGKRVQTIRLVSAPDYILRRADRVYVRCYDTDYVFAVK